MKARFVLTAVLFLSAWAQALALGVEGPAGSPGGSDPQQMQDFNIAGYDAKGDKTWEVEGASMDMMGDDVKIADITARLFGQEPDGQSMVLTADHGRFDKTSGKVRLEDNVRAVTESGAEMTTSVLDWSQTDRLISTEEKVNITRDNMEAVGTGLEAKPDLKVAKLEKDVTLTLPQQQPASAAAEEKSLGPGKMVITCDGPMELDYEEQFATFEKNVHVDSEGDQGQMVSDKMTVYFDKASKQIGKIVAEGNVKITRDGNTSHSETAVFMAKDRKMVLTGRPQLVMYMEEGGFEMGGF
ncbi:MAG: LPS export ABC transporter periplasmic protein LptC [Candidatus Omnitrophota bacterium]